MAAHPASPAKAGAAGYWVAVRGGAIADRTVYSTDPTIQPRRTTLNREIPQNQRPLQIADWQVLPDRLLVRRGNEKHALEPRLMEVLVQLALRPGVVISRQDLLDEVWGETVVQEEALTQAVSQIRRILGDDPRQPTLIETVPKRGYRLLATVTPLPPNTETAAEGSRRFPLRAAAFLAVLGVGLVLGLAFWPSSPPTDPQAEFWDARPLTSLPGDEGQGALSPAGTHVAFTRRAPESAAYKLHLKRLDSEDLIPLTDEPGNEFHPCWSPDGERIAFERRHEGQRRVCVVAAIGGPVQELGPVHWRLGGLDWSPDGATIVYSAKDKQEAPMQLFALNVADGQVDTLTTPEPLSRGDMYPRYSPDESQLALVRSDRGISRAVHLMPATGGPAVPLTDDFFSCGGLDWAPDGQSLIISAVLHGTFELWRIDTHSGAMARLPLRTQRSLSPSWPLAGGPLILTDNQLNADLMVGHFGTAEETAAAPSTRLDQSGRFAPDGQSFLFVSDRGGRRELWLQNRVDGLLRQLTDFGGTVLRKPRWSPDGRWIAVNVGREGLLQIVVIDVASGLQRQVTSDDVHHRLGHWSADGQSLFYSYEKGRGWQIAKVRFDGTGALDLPVPGCATLREEPGGELIYFKETEDGLFRRPQAGGEELVVGPDALFDQMDLQLAPDGYWFIRRTDAGAHLAFFDYATGEVADRAALQGDPIGDFHVAADGSEFVYTSVVQTGNDLVIVRDPR